MNLYSRCRPEEELLFALLGIPGWDGAEPAAVLLGPSGEPLDAHCLYVRLPEPGAPDAETRRLAAALGRAIGAKGVPL